MGGRLAGDCGAVAFERAGERAAARRDLAGGEPRLAEPLRPVGNELAMGRAGNRILVYARPRREEAGDEIDAAAARSRDDDRAIETAERGKVGLDGGDVRLALVDREPVAGGQQLCGILAERGDQAGWHLGRFRRPDGKIHRQLVALTGDDEGAGLERLEGDAAALRLDEAEGDIAPSERTIAAETHPDPPPD